MASYDALSPIRPLIVDGARLRELAGMLASLPPGSDAEVIEGMLNASLPTVSWSERYVPRKEVQLKPSSSDVLRRCARVVAMVHELHKVGYQRIRVIPQEAPSGNHWRCHVTHAGNILADGHSLKNFDPNQRGVVAHYSTGQAQEYFGWHDAAKCTARELAVLFLERFPDIANQGQGRDWLYAGWLTDFLGHMENAERVGLLAFMADYPLDPATIDPWMPPPPR